MTDDSATDKDSLLSTMLDWVSEIFVPRKEYTCEEVERGLNGSVFRHADAREGAGLERQFADPRAQRYREKLEAIKAHCDDPEAPLPRGVSIKRETDTTPVR